MSITWTVWGQVARYMYCDGRPDWADVAVDAGGGPAANATEDRADTHKRLSILLITNPLK
jgi:hypothetical protein